MSAFGDIGGVMRLRTPADFAAVIRDRRRKLGLNQQSLAHKVGVSRQWIVELEKGKTGAPLALVLRTMDALGILLTSGEGAGNRKKTSGTRSDVDIDLILENLRKKKS
jgi:HTH-type transcriptional regulator/antitoxin HipB